MPSTATITSSDLTTFASGTRIRSSPMNTNFSIWRGHIVPVDPTASAMGADKTWDVGASGASFRHVYGSGVRPYAATTGSCSLTSSMEFVAINASGATASAFLPAVSTVPIGKVFTVKKVDTSAFPVVVDGSGSETIDSTTTIAIISAYDSMDVISNGSGWYRK